MHGTSLGAIVSLPGFGAAAELNNTPNGKAKYTTLCREANLQAVAPSSALRFSEETDDSSSSSGSDGSSDSNASSSSSNSNSSCVGSGKGKRIQSARELDDLVRIQSTCYYSRSHHQEER